MNVVQAVPGSGSLTQDAVCDVLGRNLAGRFSGQRVLVLIPDHTRSLPLPELFRIVVELLHDTLRLDFMVALGTIRRYTRNRSSASSALPQTRRQPRSVMSASSITRETIPLSS